MVNSRAFRAAMATPPKARMGQMTLFRCDNVTVIVRRLISRIDRGGEPIPIREDRLTDYDPLPLREGEGTVGRSRQHLILLAGRMLRSLQSPLWNKACSDLLRYSWPVCVPGAKSALSAAIGGPA